MQEKLHIIHFHWLQQIDYLEIPKYYAASDLLVFPSEGDIWGLVVNEALSMGVPVICTERIGAAELVIDGKNGYKVPVRSPKLLAERIKHLYYDRVLLSQMSKESMKIRETWSQDLGIQSLISLVKFCCLNRK
jgi:glycosyltransferase involved in cell wall biosynthesis